MVMLVQALLHYKKFGPGSFLVYFLIINYYLSIIYPLSIHFLGFLFYIYTNTFANIHVSKFIHKPLPIDIYLNRFSAEVVNTFILLKIGMTSSILKSANYENTFYETLILLKTILQNVIN